MAGETVTVVALLENSTSTENAYTVTMTLDGVGADTTEVVVSPGGSTEVAFSFSASVAGTHEIGVGQLSCPLVVREPPREVELRYDDGTADDLLAMAKPSGYVVEFMAPSMPFVVNKVRVFGALYGDPGEGTGFLVELRDERFQVLHSEAISIFEYDYESPLWLDVEMPEVEVPEQFFVHVFTGTPRLEGVHVGVDNSVVNEHSDFSSYSGYDKRFYPSWAWKVEWPYRAREWFCDKSQVNWMIRVVGMAG